MSDCGVCLDYDADGCLEFYEADVHAARKEHACGECRRIIHKGQSYEYASGKFDGDFFTFKTCLDCAKIRDAFSCGSFTSHGELWQLMRDYGFEQMTTGCLANIETASAKAYLIEKWQEWKGLRPALAAALEPIGERPQRPDVETESRVAIEEESQEPCPDELDGYFGAR